MGCEACQPSGRGYTVYFAEDQQTKPLLSYFKNFPESTWKALNSRMFWAEEPIFYDLIDYIDAHLEKDKIFAVQASGLDPLASLHRLRAIDTFKDEREAGWIDALIAKSSIRTLYQPIVRFHGAQPEIIGHELLSRGIAEDGSIIPAFKLFEAARIRNRTFALDRVCRLQSVKNAGAVKGKMIFINFIPTAIYRPEHCLATTFQLVRELGLDPENIVFEVVETEEVEDLEHLKAILDYYRSHGFKYALDDVGQGFNNVEKLERMEPDFVKLAFEYSNGVSNDPSKQEVAKSVLSAARKLKAVPLAEGIEREADLDYLRALGYELFQGYLFSKPQESPVEVLEYESMR